jgi:predicted nucleic acid-binding protein
MADAPVHYWDSGLFIHYMTGSIPDRVAIVRALIGHVETGKCQLLTSTFTIAEVRYFRNVPGNIATHEAEIRALMEGDKIEFRALTPHIAALARDLGNAHNELTPADCVHIATAQDAGVDILFTYDGANPAQRRNPEKMLTYDGQLGTPPLAIKEPFDPWLTLGLETP